jgi:hypothetical protein
VTAVKGVATFDGVVLSKAGNYALQVWRGGWAVPIAPITAVLPATHLAIKQVPRTVVAGQVMAPAVIVQMLDATNHVVKLDGSTVTLTIGSGPANGTLGGTLSAQVIDGVATFNDLSLTKAGTYKLAASGGGFSVTSGKFTVVPAAASEMICLRGPSDCVAGVKMSPAVQFELLDAFGNVAVNDKSTVRLILCKQLGATTRTELRSVKVTKGVATFNKIIATEAGTYSLTAVDGTLSCDTPNFAVAAGSARKLEFWQGPVNVTATVGQTIVVRLLDAYGNIAVGSTTPVTLKGKTVVPVGGLATFENVVMEAPGVYKLKATGRGLSTAVSGSFTVGSAALIVPSVVI